MRISHEALYINPYVRLRGTVKRERSDIGAADIGFVARARCSGRLGLFETYSVLTSDHQRSRTGRYRGIGRGTCSWAMPMLPRSGP